MNKKFIASSGLVSVEFDTEEEMKEFIKKQNEIIKKRRKINKLMTSKGYKGRNTIGSKEL